ncbi:hypothetical protein CDD83_1767 [Cordyceps sp. RAO-2017]|nr:hypothetical protein CDD83_1767 [Cordyceps sp. RAO-2017]
MEDHTIKQIVLGACENHHDALLRWIFKYANSFPSPVDPDDGFTTLLIAADRGLARSCWHFARNRLGGRRIDFNARDRLGRTALHQACLRDHDDVVQALLYFEETDVNIRDFEGRTPLGLAGRLGHETRARLKDKAEQQIREANEPTERRIDNAVEKVEHQQRETKKWTARERRCDEGFERWLNEYYEAKEAIERQMSIIENTTRRIGQAGNKEKIEELICKAEQLARQIRESDEEVDR